MDTQKTKTKTINRSKFILIWLLFSFHGVIYAQDFGISTRNTIGVGANSIAMSNNYVAIANDASAMFWNPAGLAFMPIREFQSSMNIFLNNFKSTSRDNLSSVDFELDKQKIYLGNISYVRSIPTSQGGFTLAFGVQSPYLLDDILKYADISTGEILESYSNGNLNLFTASFGIQFAPGLALGGALSLIKGREYKDAKGSYTTAIEMISTSDTINKDVYIKSHQVINRRLTGIDLRVGIMYNPGNKLKIGIRLEVPQYITFNESYIESGNIYNLTKDTIIDQIYSESKESGTIKSSTAGALGISYSFTPFTITGELRGRSPFLNVQTGSAYASWKLGAGFGIEVPIVKSVVLRAGYSWHEFDKYPILINYETLPLDNFSPEINITSNKNEHNISGGFSLFIADGVSIDLSYSYKYYKYYWNSTLGNNLTITENHSMHQINSTLSIRF